jgi:hypothetical protein
MRYCVNTPTITLSNNNSRIKKTDHPSNAIQSFFEDYLIGAGDLSARSFRRDEISQTMN